MQRRKFITLGTVAGIASTITPALVFVGEDISDKKEKRYQKGLSPWPVCLDTATIRPASLKDKVKIAYLPDAFVYDEKIANASVFSNQRTRWISTQIEFLKKYFNEGFVQLFKGNIEFFDKVIQTILLPRILLMGTLVLFTLLALINPYGPSIFFWIAVLVGGGISLLISLPKRFYNKNLWQAVLRLPLALLSMVLAILKLKKAGQSFIHTPHTAKTDKSVIK